jgi:hypothetical protein
MSFDIFLGTVFILVGVGFLAMSVKFYKMYKQELNIEKKRAGLKS